MYDLQLSSAPPHTYVPQGRFTTPSDEDFTSILALSRPQSLEATPAESQLVSRTEQSYTLQELQTHPVFSKLWQTPPESPAEPSRLDVARDQRLAILAQQFEGVELTREDEARVAILTQRLRRLAPRVTHKAWTIAEESVSALEAVSARVDEIGTKYGL